MVECLFYTEEVVGSTPAAPTGHGSRTFSWSSGANVRVSQPRRQMMEEKKECIDEVVSEFDERVGKEVRGYAK